MDDLRYVKGIGERRAQLLSKLGIFTLRDLLHHFPRAYEDRGNIVTVAQALPGARCGIIAEVEGEPSLRQVRRGLSILTVTARDDTGRLFITFFNQPYFKNRLKPGARFLFYGEVSGSLSRRDMTNPAFYPASGDLPSGIMPVYPLTAGLTGAVMHRTVLSALDLARDRGLLADPLPESLREAHGLCGYAEALRMIHSPKTMDEAALARRRLVFEELFILQLGLLMLRERKTRQPGPPVPDTDFAPFTAALGFRLTGAQTRVLGEIAADLQSGRAMNRLVQGDVGSGKTAIAAAAAWVVIKNGWQAALMAPTELLANQHYQSLAPLMERMGLRCGLLTGGIGAAQKREAREGAQSGQIDLLIGTHALLEDSVGFARLGLVITDEQHRFGVRQRARLTAKGEHPHMCVMSATPIPRTLALLIYGDLDVSVIDELPPGRKPVETYVIDEGKRARAYGYVREHLERGLQAYVVCPLVEPGEDGAATLHSAEDTARELAEGPLRGFGVGLLHGRMKPRDKDEVMRRFVCGETGALVATTVIEVGVNVPNAVVMVVENAERFGLSQLHQLRGRVGRGAERSTCVLIQYGGGETARERLSIMRATGDGFAIAQRDLELRGPGDFIGSRQHGLPDIKVADLATDMDVLPVAQRAARELLQSDPGLRRPEHRPMLAAAREMFRSALGEGNIFN